MTTNLEPQLPQRLLGVGHPSEAGVVYAGAGAAPHAAHRPGARLRRRRAPRPVWRGISDGWKEGHVSNFMCYWYLLKMLSDAKSSSLFLNK